MPVFQRYVYDVVGYTLDVWRVEQRCCISIVSVSYNTTTIHIFDSRYQRRRRSDRGLLFFDSRTLDR